MAETSSKLSAYQWRLFLFLSVATFFEGYDQIALTQILPEFRDELGVDERGAGWTVAFINVGTILAYFLVRRSDRWGRRRVLTITIAGYTIFSFLTGLAPNVWVFAIVQFIARIFLIAEWAISMVYAAEEFPAQKRGLIIGLIGAFSSLGSVLCAGLIPVMTAIPAKLGFPDFGGWRVVYFVGTVPLVLLAFARRSLKESSRFESLSESERSEEKPLLRIFRTPYKKRVLQLAAIWGFTYVCTQTTITFWKEYAVAPPPASGPHMDSAAVASIISLAAVGAMPLVFLTGKALDWIGRKKSAVIIFVVAAGSCVLAYTVRDNYWIALLAVFGAMFGASAVMPVLNAFTAELFPTHLRGDAFAWSNNILGRIGYVIAPALVGEAAVVWGWGPPAALTAIGPIIALALILWLLPETKGRELEDTAAIH
jgi:MFS transporter, putative metabolite:H+ symporter